MYITVLEYLNKVPLEEPDYFKEVVDTCEQPEEKAAPRSLCDQ